MISLFYSSNYNLLLENTLPPDKRVEPNLSWGKVFMSAIQYLHDLFFTTYADGFTGSLYSAASTYVKGDRVRFGDHKVYEASQAVPISTPPPNTTYWRLIQNNWIGVRERVKYNGQKMLLEYALNKWFDTLFRYPPTLSDIYLTNNVLDAGGFEIAASDTLSSSIPKNEIYSDAAIGNSYNTNQNAFTIFVPLAVYNAISADPLSREPIIRAFADKYVIAGIQYNVTTY